MSPSLDLTRWNRGGLSRLRYIDGNAVTFLEDLRVELAREFPEWQAVQAEIPAEETGLKRHERLLEQYRRQTQDFGWEITRALARTCHVLTEHIDAFANEGYLGTATQWESLRRLAAMLDYHPHPPASASTPLALLAKEGVPDTVKKGVLQVKHTPPEGGAPVTFETLADIEIDAALNAIRLKGWDRATGTFYDLEVGPPGPPIGRRESLAIQGVGTTYFNLLPVKTIAGLADLDPDTVAADISPIRLWEFKTKARLVRDFQPGPDKYTALQGMTLAQILGTSTPDLVNVTGEPSRAIEELKKRLRVIQISLDETFFGEVLLADFRESGGPAEETGPVTGPALPWVLPEDLKVSSGEYALVVSGDVDWQAAVVSVTGVVEETRALHIAGHPGQPDWRGFERVDTRLWVNPESTLIPWLKGTNVVRFKEPHGLSEDNAESERDVVAWQQSNGEWVFAEVTASDAMAVALSELSEELPPVDTDLYKVNVIRKSEDEPITFALDISTPLKKTGTGRFDELVAGDENTGDYSAVPWQDAEGTEAENNTHYKVTNETIEAIYLLPEDSPSLVGEVAASGLTVGGFTFDGEPGKLKAGQWVVGETGAGLEALRVTRVQKEEAEGRFILGLANSAGGEPAVLEGIHGPLEDSIPPVDYDYNGSPVTTQPLALDLEGEWPGLLKQGREILLEQKIAEGFQGGFKATITDADPENGTINVDPPPPPGAGFTVGNTVIRGNVVTAGHGESRNEKILGSGNAAVSDQFFDLEVEGVSFVADATQPTGVRAGLDVSVEGKVWEQVPTLNDSGPEDSHYVIRMTEDGYVRIQFGDGRHGRRLLTGTNPNNVRVRSRVGTGLAGNLSAGSFEKPARPHRLIEGIRQPLAATGGNDMEGVESLRANAATGLLTLERAVSLPDFAALATTQSSVWQAAALRRMTGNPGSAGVEVVVVPAGGGELGNLKSDLKNFLQAHALPGIEVFVEDFAPVPVDLAVTVQVKPTEYNPEEVIERVREALQSIFALRNRKLGQAFYRSEVYEVVEAIAGVENSLVILEGDKARQVKPASGRAVIYLDSEKSVLELGYREFEL